MKINIHKVVNVLFFVYYFTLMIFVSNKSTLLISKVALLLMLLLMLLDSARHRYLLDVGLPIKLYAPFFIFCAMSIIWAIDRPQALTTIITLAQMFVLIIFIYGYYLLYDDAGLLIWSVVMAGLCMSFYCLHYYGIAAYITAITIKGRLGNDIANANAIAINAAIALIGCIYYFLYEKKIRYLLVSIVPVIVILGTSSRTGFLIGCFGVIVFFIVKSIDPQNVVKTIGKLIIAAIVLLIVANFMTKLLPNTSISERLETLFNYFSKSGGVVDTSTLERMQMIALGKKIFFSSPLFGIGIDNARVIASQSGFWNTYLHNNFIELLADVGIIGFVLFYFFYIVLFLKVYQILPHLKIVMKKDPWIVVISIIMLCRLIMDYGGISYYEQNFYVLYAVALLAINKCNYIRNNIDIYIKGNDCV